MEKRIRTLELLVVGLVGLAIGLVFGLVRQPIVASAQGAGNQVAAAQMGGGQVVIATPTKYKVINGMGSGGW